MEIYGMTGERLGAIGPTPPADTLPQWKASLLAKPSVSARRGIARGFAAAYEDTATLVLTSRTSWFVDIRFALGQDPTGGASYWAFAGKSEVTFPGEGRKGDRRGDGWRGGGEIVEIPCLAHCVWEHEIDSKGPGETDEGDLYLLANGQVIEVGVSTSGPSGKLEMYKEYWTEVETNEDVSCVVCRTEEGVEHEKGRGMMIRVGRHCQGIFQRQGGSVDEHGPVGGVLVERWYKSEESGAWAKDWRSNTGHDKGGDVVMPSKWVCEQGRKMGDAVELSGRTWRVVECS
jgi:hypothetical protein